MAAARSTLTPVAYSGGFVALALLAACSAGEVIGGGSSGSKPGGGNSQVPGVQQPGVQQPGVNNPGTGGPGPANPGSEDKDPDQGMSNPPGMPSAGGPPPADTCNKTLPSTFTAYCSACHTQSGQANVRYPDLYSYKGTQADFLKQVRAGGKAMAPYPAELMSDADASAVFSFFTQGNKRTGLDGVDLGGVKPLYTPADATKNPPVVYKREDGVLITRGAGRVRGRHEKEGSFGQYLAHYFEDRSYGFTVEDFTTIGQQRIRTTYLPIYTPGSPQTNWRVWKLQGNNATFAENHYFNDITEPPVKPMGPVGRPQQFDQTTIPGGRTMAVGQNFEFEFGVFIAGATMKSPGSRTSYYSDTFRYQIGVGGMTANNLDYAMTPGPAPDARLGGDTTIAWLFAEPEMYFGQMALNIQQENVQNFLEGRRLFHTDFVTGAHTDAGNPAHTAQAGKAGPLFNTTACEHCHINNGPGALLEGPMSETTSMAFKIYNGGPIGTQLQLQEGSASVAGFENKTVMVDGAAVTLKKPKFALTAKAGSVANYSGRLARKLIGLGLLEAMDERSILLRADRNDCDQDGISGRPNYVQEPKTGTLRMGRFGWKAEKVDISHQVADAAEADLGVGTSLIPDSQGKAELDDSDLMKLATYMRLLGVPPQRDAGAATTLRGEQVFKTVGCASCHVTDAVTSPNHPFAELRNQAIKPFTDMLLHDMGPDLKDESGIAYVDKADAPASASEWRTPPLWGLGLYKTVNGHTGLLHDGRAADVQEAVLWHGGEAEKVKQRFIALPAADRAALLAFVNSL